MFDSKYSKVLTIILVIVIIAIVGLLVFLGYEYYQNMMITQNTSDFVDSFQGDLIDGELPDGSSNLEGIPQDGESALDQLNDTQISSSSNSGRVMYKGFGVKGTMEIPATNFKYPVLEKVTKTSIETAVAFLYGTELNDPGNSVIIGHNYRNGLFFSNNKRLNIGDKIFVTDIRGTKMTYTIYNKFETSETDTSFYQRDTAGKPELTLSTCTDDSRARLIILARAD